MSMCRVISCVVGRVCCLWPVHSLGKTPLVFVLLHFVLQGQTCLLLQISLDFLLLHSSPLWWKGHLFGVLVLECLVGFHRTIQRHLLQHYQLGHRVGLLWFEWFSLETNRDYSVIFEIAPKNCILDSFADYEGYSISSKGFLPTIVDIMVIWIKFAHSSPFSSQIPKMSMFTLAISCLTTSNLPWFMDLTGGGNGTPLQYFCLENLMDGGAW